MLCSTAVSCDLIVSTASQEHYMMTSLYTKNAVLFIKYLDNKSLKSKEMLSQKLLDSNKNRVLVEHTIIREISDINIYKFELYK